MFKSFLAMLRSDGGQGLAEYALIVALIAVVAIAALSFLGTSSRSQINSAGIALNNLPAI